MDPRDLECVFTLSLLEDPILLPCCGKSVSRQPLIEQIEQFHNHNCPCCRTPFPPTFDPHSTPRNRALADLVEQYRNSLSANTPPPSTTTSSEWRARLTCLPSKPSNSTQDIAQLRISLTRGDFVVKPSVFIALVDRSGSMGGEAGSPWSQVLMSLDHMVAKTLANPQVTTHVVVYGSTADLVPLPRTSQAADLADFHRRLNFGGGTDFNCAFDRLSEVLRSMNPAEVSHVTVVIMTDGQADSSRTNLITRFAQVLSQWTGPLTTHCVGFGSSCDKEFLESLRQARPENAGTFRYAEPRDHADTLSSKMTSLFDLSSRAASVPLILRLPATWQAWGSSSSVDTEILLPINRDGDGELDLWVEIPDSPSTENLMIRRPEDPNDFSSPLVIIPVTRVTENSEMETVRQKWVGRLIDQLASQLLELSQRVFDPSVPRLAELYLGVVLQKLDLLSPLVTSQMGDNATRLQLLRDQAMALSRGQRVNVGVLSDARFGSQFSGTCSPSSTVSHETSRLPAPTTVKTEKLKDTPAWEERRVFYSRANHPDRRRNPLLRVIVEYQKPHSRDLPAELINQINQATYDEIVSDVDREGNNALHLAAYCGHSKILQALLSRLRELKPTSSLAPILTQKNVEGETAVTLAIKKRGFHVSLEILEDHGGGIPAHRRRHLEEFAWDDDYPRTVRQMNMMPDEIESTEISVGPDDQQNQKSIQVTEFKLEFDASMNAKYLQLILSRVAQQPRERLISVTPDRWNEFLDLCLAKGLVDGARQLIRDHGARPSIAMLLDYCVPPKPDDPQTPHYLELAQLVLDTCPDLIHQRLPPSAEQLEIAQRSRPLTTHGGGSSVTELGETALFRAAERGSLPHVQFFLDRGANIEAQNELGNSPLWIACAKRWPCIAAELLARGADPNAVNLKGNPPIYSLCTRGPLKMLDLLLSYGAKVDLINANGDTLPLMCCRNGQPELLERMLSQLSGPNDPLVLWRAAIDGFDVIFACVEADQAECLRVLIRYGVSLERRTASDNAILPEATPLHLAAFYGRPATTRVLLSHGVEVDPLNAQGQSPLHLAVIQGHVEVVRLLRQAGANTSLLDSFGNSPLSFASRSPLVLEVLKPPALDILIHFSRGAGLSVEDLEKVSRVLSQAMGPGLPGLASPSQLIDLPSHDGTTPLLDCVIHGNVTLGNTLLTLGANPLIRNLHGNHALGWTRVVNEARWSTLMRSVISVPENQQELDQITGHLRQARTRDPQLLFFLGRPSLSCQVALPLIMSSCPSRWSLAFDLQPVNTSSDVTSTPPSQFDTTEQETRQMLSLLSLTDVSLVEDKKKKKNQKSQQQNSTPSSSSDSDSNNNTETEVWRWNAKVFTANLIASGEKVLPPSLIFALCLYTNNGVLPRLIHRTLMCPRPPGGPKNSLLDGMLSVLSGDLLPGHQGECYLAVRNLRRQDFLPDGVLRNPALFSACTSWATSHQFVEDTPKSLETPTLLLIHSHTARSISRYSQFSFDGEVIFLPGTRFRVLRWYRFHRFCLQQRNIREHTYAMKQSQEIQDALTSTSPVIIELSELSDE